MNLLDFRRACHFVLHRPVGPWAKFWNAFLAAVIIFSIAAAPLHFFARYQGVAHRFEIFAVGIFTIEYFLRIWSAAWPRKYLFSWASIIDLVAILPFYLAIFGVISFQTAAIFLLLRILKLGKIYELERLSINKICQKAHGDFHTFPDEKIEKIIHRHPIVFFFGLLPVLVFTSFGLAILVIFPGNFLGISFAALFFALAILFFFKSWLDFHYDVIYVTNRRIIVQNRQLFGTQLNDISYEAITNIKPDTTSFWHFLFGFGDIQIKTAAENENQFFPDAADAQKAVDLISKNRQKVLARDDIAPILERQKK